MRSSKGPSPRVAEADLKCKNDECEFYGNAQWEGYCSKCRKIFTRAAKSESRVRHSDSSSSHERCVVLCVSAVIAAHISHITAFVQPCSYFSLAKAANRPTARLIAAAAAVSLGLRKKDDNKLRRNPRASMFSKNPPAHEVCTNFRILFL